MGYSPWGHKDSDMTEHTHTHAAQSLISLKSFFFFATLYGMWDLCSPTRDRPHVPPALGVQSLNTGLPKKSVNSF